MQIALNRYALGKVFTPSSTARLTYVERVALESDVEKFIQIPGMQIVLYGHSGCGKSTLISNKLDKLGLQCIKTSCEARTKFDEVLFQAFDKLNLFFTSEKSWKNGLSQGGKLSKYGLELSAIVNSEKAEKSQRCLPPQLTPQRLAEYLGKSELIWVIEDFHKMATEEKKKVADVLKVFMDAASEFPKVKIICIGAVGTARELVELESNLSSRVAEINVPLLSDDELRAIAEKGFRLLNVGFSSDVSEKIIHYSNRLASVCHQICYDICFGKRIIKTRFFKVAVDAKDFEDAVLAYLRKNSDTMAKIYDKINTRKVRRDLLRKFIGSQKEFLTLSEILALFGKAAHKNQHDEIGLALNELTSADYSDIFSYDPNSMKYSISNPFFHAYAKMAIAMEDEAALKQKTDKSTFFIRTSPNARVQINEEIMRRMLTDIIKIQAERNAARNVEIINTQAIINDKPLPSQSRHERRRNKRNAK